MTLDLVPPQGRCLVTDVLGTDGVSQRLMEMGVIEGSEIEVVRLAPLGDPMELRVYGYHLSVRKSDAARVVVQPCP